MPKGFFTLTVHPKSTPKAVIDLNTYSYNWRRSEAGSGGPQKIRARLIHLGWVNNVEEAKMRAKERGYALLGGEAAESFIQKFPVAGKAHRLINFGGCYWVCGQLARLKPTDDFCHWVASAVKVIVYISGQKGTWKMGVNYPGTGFIRQQLWAVTPIDAKK